MSRTADDGKAGRASKAPDVSERRGRRAGGQADPVVRRLPRWVLPVVIVAIAVEAALLAYLFLSGPPCAVPELPDLRGRPPAMAEHLRWADRAARSSPSSAEAVGSLGMAYHADSFSELAATCYGIARDLDPDDWRWPYYLVLLAEDRGDSEALLEGLRRVVTLRADHAQAWYRLGMAELKRGNGPAAAEAFQRAIQTDSAPADAGGDEPRSHGFPVSSYATWGLAQVLLAGDRATEARDILTPVVMDHPAFGAAHRVLAQALERLGQAEESRRHFDEASSCSPFCPPPDSEIDTLLRISASSDFLLRYLGIAMKSKDHRWAEYLARRAIEVAPDDLDAIFQLGRLLFDLRRWEEALPLLERYCKISPDAELVVKVRNNAGVCLLNLRRFEEARARFLEALPDSPRPAIVHNNLALVARELGDLPRAGEHLREALLADPECVEAHVLASQLFLRVGRVAEAERHALEAVRVWPACAEGWLALGNISFRRGDFPEAVRQLRTAVRHRPDFPEALTTLAWMLATCPRDDVRDGDEALRAAERACRLTSHTDLKALDALAAAHAEKGQFEHAVAVVSRGVEVATRQSLDGAVATFEARKVQYTSRNPYRERVPGGE